MSITEGSQKPAIVGTMKRRLIWPGTISSKARLPLLVRRLSVRENGPVLLSARRKIKLLPFQEKTADSSG
jgi:hypothetical protein